MGVHRVRLPDIGEGIAEAEVSEWQVKVGDTILEDDVICVVMTDKAAVEVPAPVTGTVTWIAGEAGDVVSIGAPLVELEVDGAGNVAADDAERTTGRADAPDAIERSEHDEHAKDARTAEPDSGNTNDIEKGTERLVASRSSTGASSRPSLQASTNDRPLAAPTVRHRAKTLGIELSTLVGSGPDGRITHEDLDDWLTDGSAGGPRSSARTRQRASGGEAIKLIGMRRRIAEKTSVSASRIPHITVVEEVDVTELERLRDVLNQTHAGSRGKLTLLPFLIETLVSAIHQQPMFNATFDDEAGIVQQSNAVHVGIATQTHDGLVVPVLRHAEAGDIWQNAGEIRRLSGAARAGKATREELSGSTITISSLGALGALATTPIINHPEVAIIGVNRIAMRPHWDGHAFTPRQMMNLSCSFDHRIIDGWDAAVFVQAVKSRLETPARMFLDA